MHIRIYTVTRNVKGAMVDKFTRTKTERKGATESRPKVLPKKEKGDR